MSRARNYSLAWFAFGLGAGRAMEDYGNKDWAGIAADVFAMLVVVGGWYLWTVLRERYAVVRRGSVR